MCSDTLTTGTCGTGKEKGQSFESTKTLFQQKKLNSSIVQDCKGTSLCKEL